MESRQHPFVKLEDQPPSDKSSKNSRPRSTHNRGVLILRALTLFKPKSSDKKKTAPTAQEKPQHYTLLSTFPPVKTHQPPVDLEDHANVPPRTSSEYYRN